MIQRTHRLLALIALPLISIFAVSANAQVNLRDHARVYEVISPNSPEQDRPMADVMDKRHNVRITFDRDSLVKALRATLTSTKTVARVRIRVEAQLQHNAGQAQPIPVDNYCTVKQEEPSAGTTPPAPSTSGVKTIKYIYHDQLLEADATDVKGYLPESFINLTQIGVDSGDRLYVKITDVQTQSDVNYVVSIGEYDWNLKITDSFLLLKRLNVSKAEEADGEKQVNFRPAPGVTFGYVYSGRKGLKKVLSPGVGYNVSFTDWNDPAFDISTGKFAKGTEASKIDITTGPIFSLFNNTLHFTYGWNLSARTDRKYWGIGFSFFNLSQKIAGLISDK